MSLFAKKKNIMEGIPVIFYDGELESFATNMPCNLLLKDQVLQIKKVNPEVTVKLDATRITSIDIFLKESEYMLKYKGYATSTSKSKIEKTYFVVNYKTKSEEAKHLDFWCTVFEISKIRNIIEEIFSGNAPKTYEL